MRHESGAVWTVEGNHTRYEDSQSGRWATVTLRDYPLTRNPSYHVVYSDGRQMGGEWNPHVLHQLVANWVRGPHVARLAQVSSGYDRRHMQDAAQALLLN